MKFDTGGVLLKSVSTLEYGLKSVKITDTSYENPQTCLPISRAKLAKYLWQRQNISNESCSEN
jgi:hypothetical protein